MRPLLELRHQVQVEVDDHIGHGKIWIETVCEGNRPDAGLAIEVKGVRRTPIFSIMPPDLPTPDVLRAGKT